MLRIPFATIFHLDLELFTPEVQQVIVDYLG